MPYPLLVPTFALGAEFAAATGAAVGEDQLGADGAGSADDKLVRGGALLQAGGSSGVSLVFGGLST